MFRNYVQHALTAGKSYEIAIREALLFVILGLASSAIIMWAINVWLWKEINYVFFFLGLLLLIGKGTKPVVWSTAILTGGAWNLAQLKNPLRGGSEGLVFWITKGLPAVIVFWLFLTGFLATWSFEKSPGSFFPIAGFGILIFFALTAWEKWEGAWMFNIILWYSVGVIIIAIAKTTFMGDWIDWASDPQAREEVRIEQLETKRQAEIGQAIHAATVERARETVLAPRLVSPDQIVDGCQQLAGVQSGLYRFILGTEGCRHITLSPNEYYDAAKGPSIEGPRCTRWYPARTSVTYLDRPGPDRMTNTGDAEEQFVVYFLEAGEQDPVDNSYICG